MSTSIIQFDANDTGFVIGDLTWDFCKKLTGIAVVTTDSTLVELGVGVYELTNPNVTERTTFSIHKTTDSSKRVVGEFATNDGEVLSSLNAPGYSTYLQLLNKVLKRITQSEAATVGAATGTTKIVTELINEAQIELWTETTNWYTLYATRNIATVAGTATYAHASNFGRVIDLTDVTNNRILVEDNIRGLDEANPDLTTQGNATHFSIQGGNYRLYPVPSGIVTLRDRYWKIPGTMSADGSTSDLPLFCENFIIHWSLMRVLEYLNKFDAADRIRVQLYGQPGKQQESILYKCKAANKKVLDQMFRFDSVENRVGLMPPRFPSNY